jgi:TonB family protein
MSSWNETAWFSFFAGLALKSTVLLAVGCLLAFLMRRMSAASRHMVWTAAAAALLALPFFAISLPALRVPAARAASAITFHTTVLATQPAAVAPARSDAARSDAASHAAPPVKQPSRSIDWKLWLMLVWGAGAALVLAQMLVACAAVWRLRRTSPPFGPRELNLCQALARALGIQRRVDVIETKSGSMPMTFGVLRSAIFMPSDASQWTEERRRMVLLHELAHVRRGDAAARLVARTAVSLYWWNPLAWKAWRSFLKEQERAADDLVLNAGANATNYAEHLLAVARAMACFDHDGWPAVAMARQSQLEGRLAAILDPGLRRKAPSRAAALLVTLVAIAILTPLAAIRAQETKAPVPADVEAAIRAASSQKNPQILEDAAKAAEQQSKLDTAQQLLEPAVAIRGEVAGQHSVAYGLGLLKLGDLDSKRHLENSAVDFYTRGAQIIGDRPEAAPALMFLGIHALKQKNYSPATDYFQHAQNVDPTRAGQALMWMAVTRQRDNDAEQAAGLYQRALSFTNPASPDAVTLMEVYAQFLRKQGQKNESDDFANRASALQKTLATDKPKITAGVSRMGPGVAPPTLLSSSQPEYSELARIALLQGTVRISVEIGTDGLAHNAQVVSGLGMGLDETAVEAVQHWVFKPGMKDGQPIPVAASVEVNFRLL